MAFYYDWFVITRDGGRERRRKLRWKMTMPDAIEWGMHPDNQGKILELVPGSAERRGDPDGTPHIGWGISDPLTRH